MPNHSLILVFLLLFRPVSLVAKFAIEISVKNTISPCSFNLICTRNMGIGIPLVSLSAMGMGRLHRPSPSPAPHLLLDVLWGCWQSASLLALFLGTEFWERFFGDGLLGKRLRGD
jgi:hypothetical protein